MTAGAPPEHQNPDPEGMPAPNGSRGWRPALRIAGRTVRRNLGRSLLVAALVAIPVAGATLVDGVYRSTDNPERDAYQAIGNADALVVVTEREPLPESWMPDPDSYVGVGPPDTQRDPAEVDPDELLPDGTELTPAARTYWNMRVVRESGTTSARVVATEMNDPATEHLVRLESGRWPANDDEVLINEPLAERLDLLDDGDLSAGATVTLPDGPTVDVTGLGLHPRNLDGDDLFAAPGSVVIDHLDSIGAAGNWSNLAADPGSDAYLASLPDGADADTLWPELAERGVAMMPRAAYLDPDAYTNSTGSGPVSAQTLQLAAAFALMVGLGLLEVILLAGAAFAVGARRQVRDLGLVAAGGGTSAHVRRIVLAQGLVLGAIGATLGVAVGVALTVAGRPLWQSFDNALIETWRWGEIEIAIAAAVGLLSGLAAAVVPAIGAARRNPIDALAQRFRTTPLTAHLPELGVILVVLGASGALAASRALVADIRAYAESLQAAGRTGIGVGSPNETGYVALQLLGVVTAVAGLILLIPFVVTWVARRVRRSPVAARFAARDAARHRHRTAPAVAAIMIVVAGASGVAYALAAQEDVDRLRYTPSLPDDVLELSPGVDLIDPAVADAVADELPDATVLMVEGPTEGVSTYPDGTERHSPAYVNADCVEVGDASAAWCSGALEPLTIASPALLELAYGEGAEDDVRSALDGGHVIVPSDGFASDDGIVAIEAFEPEATEPPEPVHLPAHVLNPDTPHYNQVPLTLVSAQAADAAGWDIVPREALIRYDPGSATEDDLDNAHDVADRHGHHLMAEHGPPSMRTGFVALAAGAGFVTLVGVGVVVSLAAAEGRADLATMAAVGAPPRRRRAIAGWQALFVAGLGSVLGLALGTYYGYLAYPVYGAPEFAVPWLTIAATGVGVPLLASVVAVLFTRSRLPMVRRIE